MNNIFLFFTGTGLTKPFSLCTAGVSRADPNDPNSSIFVKKRNSSEFAYIISGKGTIICNSKEYKVKAGDVYFVPRGCDSASFPDKDDPWLTVWLNSFGDLIPDIMTAYNLIKIVHFPDATCYPLFKKIIQICRDKTLTSEEKDMQISIVMHEIIQVLYASPNINKTQVMTTRSMQKDAHTLKVYMDNHINDNVKMSTLAELVFRSESQTIRIFKQIYGMTPYNYLLGMRIKSAQQLLEQTNLSIKEVAYNLGFSDEHYFSHLFKAKTGKTPTNYRKDVLKNREI